MLRQFVRSIAVNKFRLTVTSRVRFLSSESSNIDQYVTPADRLSNYQKGKEQYEQSETNLKDNDESKDKNESQSKDGDNEKCQKKVDGKKFVKEKINANHIHVHIHIGK